MSRIPGRTINSMGMGESVTMVRILLGHDVPNWAFIGMTLLAVLLWEGVASALDKLERNRTYDEPDRP